MAPASRPDCGYILKRPYNIIISSLLMVLGLRGVKTIYRKSWFMNLEKFRFNLLSLLQGSPYFGCLI